MISSIGGTLGLFCGFSLLSGIEAIYWGLKGIAGTRNGQKKKPKRKSIKKSSRKFV